MVEHEDGDIVKWQLDIHNGKEGTHVGIAFPDLDDALGVAKTWLEKGCVIVLGPPTDRGDS